MNVLSHVVNHIQYFDDQTSLLLDLGSSEVDNMDRHSQGALVEMMKMVDENTPDQKKEWIVDFLREVVHYDNIPGVFTLHQGENFSVEVSLEQGQDFTNFNLTLRRADTLDLIGPNDIQGDSYSNDAVQEIPVEDLALPEGEFFKAYVLVEEADSNDLATGDAVNRLDEIFIIVRPDIDVSSS